jgi:predicted aspartyl protease
VDAAITGPLCARTYNFLVDTGSAHLGLPLEEIEPLGLQMIPDGKTRFLTANGVVELDTYGISGRVLSGRTGGKGFVAMVAAAPVPLIGYEMLQSMRMRVNPVSERLEDVPDDVIDHPPYILWLSSHFSGVS